MIGWLAPQGFLKIEYVGARTATKSLVVQRELAAQEPWAASSQVVRKWFESAEAKRGRLGPECASS